MSRRGRRAGTFYRRLLRVIAWLLGRMGPPACECEAEAKATAHGHKTDCPRWAYLRVAAILNRQGLDPYQGGSIGWAIDGIEEDEVIDDIPKWKGTGMDPVVAAWFRREIIRAQDRRTRSKVKTAHDSRIKALKDAVKAIRQYANRGTQIVNMNEEVA